MNKWTPNLLMQRGIMLQRIGLPRNFQYRSPTHTFRSPSKKSMTQWPQCQHIQPSDILERCLKHMLYSLIIKTNEDSKTQRKSTTQIKHNTNNKAILYNHLSMQMLATHWTLTRSHILPDNNQSTTALGPTLASKHLSTTANHTFQKKSPMQLPPICCQTAKSLNTSSPIQNTTSQEDETCRPQIPLHQLPKPKKPKHQSIRTNAIDHDSTGQHTPFTQPQQPDIHQCIVLTWSTHISQLYTLALITNTAKDKRHKTSTVQEKNAQAHVPLLNNAQHLNN